MFIQLLFFLFIISFFIAKLEINIEGKGGWARNLPTWKVKNRLTAVIWGDLPLTGYHLWLIGSVLLFLHFPFFLGLLWSLGLEFEIIALFFFFWMLEDFFWFVLNPSYGIRKFNKESIVWHSKWIGRVPISYVKFFSAGAIMLALSILVV